MRTPRLAGCRTRGGFTLIEVMVALFLFVFAVGGLAIALDTTFTSSLVLRRDQEVRQQISSLLDESLETPLEDLAERRKVGPDAAGATYEVWAEVADLRNREDEQLFNLYWVTVQATWSERGEIQELSARYLRYRP